MNDQRDEELRQSLGYTQNDLRDLVMETWGEGMTLAELPPFPKKEEPERRKRLYEFLRKVGKYAAIFAWCRSHEITKGFDGLRTSELYKDDPQAKCRHWLLANTQEQFYEVMRANEAFIANQSPQTMRQMNEEKKVFFIKLGELCESIANGDWGEQPPSGLLVRTARQLGLDVDRLLAANGQIAPSLERALLRRPDAWKEIERGLA